MKRASSRKHFCLPILLASTLLLGCGDSDGQDAANQDEEETRIAEAHGWKVSTECNSKNIIGTWEKHISDDVDPEGFTVRLVFESDGTLTDSTIRGSFEDAVTGEFEILNGRMVTRNWYTRDDGDSYAEYNEGCYIIENGLYLNYDIFFNPEADAESMDGTWVLRAAGIEESNNTDGSSEGNTEDESLTLSIRGTSVEFTKLEVWDEFENGTLTYHNDTPEFKASGTIRVNDNEVYTTFTSEEIDQFDQIALNQEDLIGLRMTRQLLMYTTDPSDDPFGNPYVKVH